MIITGRERATKGEISVPKPTALSPSLIATGKTTPPLKRWNICVPPSVWLKVLS